VRVEFPNLLHNKHRLNFIQWFVTQAPLEYEIDALFLQPTLNILGQFFMNVIDVIIPVYKGLEENTSLY
jgi:hypothetical protein